MPPAIGQPLPPSPRHRAQEQWKGSTWELRCARISDVQQMARLETLLFADEAWSEDMLREEIAHASRRYVVAVDEHDAVLGYAGIMLSGEIADVHTIGTIVEGVGVGRALLAWIEDAARSAQAVRLMLEVRVDNTRAQDFYRQAGFVLLGRRRDYYRTARGAVDALVMAKDL